MISRIGPEFVHSGRETIVDQLDKVIVGVHVHHLTSETIFNFLQFRENVDMTNH